MCKGCRVDVKGLFEEATDRVKCLDCEMHGSDMRMGKV